MLMPSVGKRSRPGKDYDDEDADEQIADVENDIADLEEELQPLHDLKGEALESSEWEDGTTLILDEYFEEYARDLAEDIYDIKDHWPFNCIDWGFAAHMLTQDYFSVDYGGYTYWIRS